MINDTHQAFWETYYGALHEVVTNAGLIHERLKAAVEILKKNRTLLKYPPHDEFERKVCLPLVELVELGMRLETMSEKDMKDLAWKIAATYEAVTEAYGEFIDGEYAAGRCGGYGPDGRPIQVEASENGTQESRTLDVKPSVN